tara:strand:+ start:100 stop:729 length:630 start_codon:yes stop_codon:yes gene_type:complete
MGVDKFNFSYFFNNEINASIQNQNFKIDSNVAGVPVQTHSSNIKFITKPGVYKNCDGLITSKKYNVPLIIKIADCVPIYIYDTKTQYYGLLHSGWKGTKDHIIIKALEIFNNVSNLLLENIKICIGPHIKSCCYEVDWDVAQYFSFFKKNKPKNKWLLNLEKEIKYDAINQGILSKNIFTVDICTYESLECESFRRDGKKSKRMIGVIS